MTHQPPDQPGIEQQYRDEVLRYQLLRQIVDLENAIDACICHAVVVGKRKDILCEWVLGYDLTPLHRNIYEYQRDNQTGLILCFRGAGKSTISTKAEAIFRAVAYPNERTLIVSSNDEQAQKLIRGIRAHFENNETFIRIFGDLRDMTRWSQRELNVNTRSALHDEATITVAGIESAKIIGMHVENLIFDDIINVENSRTELQREKVVELVTNAVNPTLEPGGRQWVIGTRYAPRDYYGHLLRTEFADNHLIIPIWTFVDGEYVSAWPEKFSVAWIRKKEESGRVAFLLQYLNQAEVGSGSVFELDWFQYYDDAIPFNDDNAYNLVTVDLALSERSKADYFVALLATVTTDRKVYIRDYIRVKESFPNQEKIIIDLIKRYRPRKVFIEAVAYQAAMYQNLVSKYPNLARSIQPVPTRRTKVERANNISGDIRGNVFLPDSFGPESLTKTRFIDEVVQFPHLDHDDVVDAFIMLMEAVFQKGSGTPRKSSYSDELDEFQYEDFGDDEEYVGLL